MQQLTTERLCIRLVVEGDRDVFVHLFTDDDYMVFSEHGALGIGAANKRFNHMLELGQELSYSKQAIIETATGEIIGYAGADYFELRGEQRLEFGYRLIGRVRGLGYATEASRALLDRVRADYHGELLAIIDPKNEPSRKVLQKIGFHLLERIVMFGGDTELWSMRF